MAGLWAFLNSTPVVIVFYVLVFALIYLKRDKFEIQAKIIALYRTQIGIPWINSVAKKYGGIIRGWAKAMVIPAWLFMVLICVFLIQSTFMLFLQPETAAGVAPILPGVQVPGSPIKLPLWHGILSIFIVATVHEAAHGLVAAAHKLKIQATGIFVMGPIPGAFVEPDEKALVKSPKKVQTAIFAAGPMANMVLAFLFFGLLFCTNTLWMDTAEPYVIGMSFNAIVQDLPAHQAGVQPGIQFTHVNGQEILSTADFTKVMEGISPGDTLVLVSETGSEYTLVAGQHPDHWKASGYSGFRLWLLDKVAPDGPPESGILLEAVEILDNGDSGVKPGYIGIMGMRMHFQEWSKGDAAKLGFISWWHELILWIVILSSGIGLVNLLPLGPADGGRMIQLVFRDWWGKEKGDERWKHLSVVTVVILAVNIFVPMFRSVLNYLFSMLLTVLGMG